MWSFREIFKFVFREIFLQFREIKDYFVKISQSTKFWQIILIFAKFDENFAKHEIKNFAKFQKQSFSATLCRTGVRGAEVGQYSPGASSPITQIVPYSASFYTVFHSVIYNSVVQTFECRQQSADDCLNQYPATEHCGQHYDRNAHILIQALMHANSVILIRKRNTHAYHKQWWSPFYFDKFRL